MVSLADSYAVGNCFNPLNRGGDIQTNGKNPFAAIMAGFVSILLIEAGIFKRNSK